MRSGRTERGCLLAPSQSRHSVQETAAEPNLCVPFSVRPGWLEPFPTTDVGVEAPALLAESEARLEVEDEALAVDRALRSIPASESSRGDLR